MNKIRTKTLCTNADYFNFIKKNPAVKILNVSYNKKKQIKIWYEEVIKRSKKELLS